MVWTAIITLSVLVTAQPEYDGALWRVYPGNQKYFHNNDAAVAMKTPTQQPGTKPEENITVLPFAKAPAKQLPAKPLTVKSTESSFGQGLKQQIVNQRQREIKVVVTTTPPVQQKTIVTASPVELKKDIVIEYRLNGFHLTASQKKIIASRIALFRQADRIRIDAYADMTGSAQYNKLLTDRRAREVKQFITQLGIEQDKILVRGLGQTNKLPLGKNTRRSEIWIRGGEHAHCRGRNDPRGGALCSSINAPVRNPLDSSMGKFKK